MPSHVHSHSHPCCQRYTMLEVRIPASWVLKTEKTYMLFVTIFVFISLTHLNCNQCTHNESNKLKHGCTSEHFCGQDVTSHSLKLRVHKQCKFPHHFGCKKYGKGRGENSEEETMWNNGRMHIYKATRWKWVTAVILVACSLFCLHFSSTSDLLSMQLRLGV